MWSLLPEGFKKLCCGGIGIIGIMHPPNELFKPKTAMGLAWLATLRTKAGPAGPADPKQCHVVNFLVFGHMHMVVHLLGREAQGTVRIWIWRENGTNAWRRGWRGFPSVLFSVFILVFILQTKWCPGHVESAECSPILTTTFDGFHRRFACNLDTFTP